MEQPLDQKKLFTSFSESSIWQLNRDYYEEAGIDAWRSGVVPHHVTSNSMVGRTYAELILGFLRDVSEQGNTTDVVYILELGAGHGRLSFHILQHLEILIRLSSQVLPPFCYILSDIVEEDLDFYRNHNQLQKFFDKGCLDIAYFDAVESQEIKLRYSGKLIERSDLNQPIVALANYFFDSIPVDLFRLEDDKIYSCMVCVDTSKTVMGDSSTIENIKLEYKETLVANTFYNDAVDNEILSEYSSKDLSTYLFYPRKSMHCLHNLSSLSKKGLMVLSMDKGFHVLSELDKKEKPDVIKHGSFSLWVNYHALGAYCKNKGAKVLFPDYSNFHIEVACFLMLSNEDSYNNTIGAYERLVNNFGPDDFNTIKKMSYRNARHLELSEIIAVIRLGASDSSLFMRLLPMIKLHVKQISLEDRIRLVQLLRQVSHFYFHIGESDDVVFAIGGLYYDLGCYEESLNSFRQSVTNYGPKEDSYYNMALCFYQLRMDTEFVKILKETQNLYPDSISTAELKKLDLTAV
jgi:tetratricopeptide (TPR) repeat protein